jgi:hypothetical protein
MNAAPRPPRHRERGSAFVACLIMMVIVTAVIASLAAYVTHTTHLANRRRDIIAANQFAQGGALIAADDLNRALTNRLLPMVTSLAAQYEIRGDLTTSELTVYQRTISAPFSNQTVTAQIWITNVTAASDARVVGIATVADVTQTASLNVQLSFGYAAAIISDSPGSTSSGISKSTAQDGNVVINGDKTGPIVVDGNGANAVWANGRANIDTNYAKIPPTAVVERAYNTTDQIPDYTADGSTDQLFDFKRFIAVADATPNGFAPSGNNHFTNFISFINAVKPGTVLEGVIVVDVKSTGEAGINDLNPSDLPYGINVRGTLIFNFGPAFKADDKIINTATMNINPANLSGLVPKDPSTYTTGYPPVYTDETRAPYNIVTEFPQFREDDDLPALMYTIGILDIHGNANISGVVYTPSFMEIENKQDGQTQYFKGSLIAGGGVYFENLKDATSIISYDGNALDRVATAANKGRRVVATYWQ